MKQLNCRWTRCRSRRREARQNGCCNHAQFAWSFQPGCRTESESNTGANPLLLTEAKQSCNQNETFDIEPEPEQNHNLLRLLPVRWKRFGASLSRLIARSMSAVTRGCHEALCVTTLRLSRMSALRMLLHAFAVVSAFDKVNNFILLFFFQ